MNEFMKTLLSLSVSGTLLLLFLLGLKRLYKNKFSRGWQYYIWVIVALRFLLPFTADTTVVGSLFEKFDAKTVTDGSYIQNVDNQGRADGGGAKPIQEGKGLTAAAAHTPFHLYACLSFAWLALALALLARKLMVYQSFIRRIRAGSIEASDTETLKLLSDCKEKLNIKANVGLFHNPLISSPMLIGFFQPCILMPDSELGEKELSYIFMHELIHYKQKDMFYKWMIQIVVCIHWFNPFVYLLEKEVNQSCELSCDEKVIVLLDDKQRREYGDMLISFLKLSNPCTNSLASVTLSEGAKQIKERLGAIMVFKGKAKTTRALTGALTLCILFGAAFLGSYTVAGAVDASPMGIGSARAGNLRMPDEMGMPEQLCENCGQMGQRAVKVRAYETGPEVKECLHGYPYGDDLVYKEYTTYQYQCSACSYSGAFLDTYSGTVRECHGYYPDR